MAKSTRMEHRRPKRCPFCKSTGVVLMDDRPLWSVDKDGKAKVRTLYAVGCQDDACWMRPRTAWYSDINAALRVWNRRLLRPLV